MAENDLVIYFQGYERCLVRTKLIHIVAEHAIFYKSCLNSKYVNLNTHSVKYGSAIVIPTLYKNKGNNSLDVCKEANYMCVLVQGL